MKIYSLFVFVLCISTNSLFSQSNQQFINQDGIEITYTKSHCDLKMGYDQEWVLFTFKNNNNYPVTVIWDLQMWIDNDCKTCNDPSGEYHRTLELQPNEELQGSCDVNEDNRLYLFSKFEDQNTNMTYELTDFDFANFTVVNMSGSN